MNCNDCRWSNPLKETVGTQHPLVFCCRFPPQVVLQGLHPVGYFPKVPGHWCCGEHRPIDPPLSAPAPAAMTDQAAAEETAAKTRKPRRALAN
jgi:hypothetical protein